MNDVIVCGAGPAGAALAILLGRSGLSVALFEQRRFPRDKTCAEGIFPAGVAVLQRMGLADAVGGARLRGVRHHVWGHVLEARFPPSPTIPAFGLGQRRLHLDATLFEAARATRGVTVHEAVRVDAPIIESGRARGVLAQGKAHHAQLVVAADGPRSVLRRGMGLDGAADRRPRLGVRAHFRLAKNRAVPEQVEVFFTEGYELYLTPLPDGSVVLAGLAERAAISGDPKSWLPARIGDHAVLAELLAGAVTIGPIAGQGPLSSSARRGHAPGFLLLGDAAGFVDPVTGTGMTQALLSAELLAQTLARASHGRTHFAADPVLECFDRERRALLSDSVQLTRLVLALTRHPRLARGTLALLRAAPGLYAHMVGVAGGSRSLLPALRLSASAQASVPGERQ